MGLVTAKPRLDIRRLILKRAEVSLRPDEFFAETPKSFRLCDKFGIKCTYAKAKVVELKLYEKAQQG